MIVRCRFMVLDPRSKISALFLHALALACLGVAIASPQVTRAEDYKALFQRDQGWTGADGAYSVSLGDRTLWLFSDTFVGSVVEGRRSPDTVMVHNTMALQEGGALEFVTDVPLEPPDGRGWFWMYDGVADGDSVLVFLGQFEETGEGGAFGFRPVGVWTARLAVREDISVEGYRRVPFEQFGSAVLRDGDWDYVYGVSPERQALVARAPRGELEDFASWRFFDGRGWSDQPAAIAGEVSMEYSVHRTRGGDYVMVSGRGGLSPDVLVRRAPTPWGPWSEPTVVYRAPEHQGQDFVYNAKAHPELSDERGLLISYNVNTMDLERVLEVADVYRPRFVRLAGEEYLP